MVEENPAFLAYSITHLNISAPSQLLLRFQGHCLRKASRIWWQTLWFSFKSVLHLTEFLESNSCPNIARAPWNILWQHTYRLYKQVYVPPNLCEELGMRTIFLGDWAFPFGGRIKSCRVMNYKRSPDQEAECLGLRPGCPLSAHWFIFPCQRNEDRSSRPSCLPERL